MPGARPAGFSRAPKARAFPQTLIACTRHPEPLASKIIGILTRDFAMYRELVSYLKDREVPFVSLGAGEPIPENVGAIVTTDPEADRIPFGIVVPFKTPHQALDEARRLMEDGRIVGSLTIGIDPGERPGLAVYADGREIRAYQVAAPEAVESEVSRLLATYKAEEPVVRIGHGAPTARDRIVNALLDMDARLEIVDETSTSPHIPRGGTARDVAAARAIALTEGEEVRERRAIRPGERELRDIQRKSRIASGGELTISRDLALQVARGKLTLEQALDRQRREASP